MRMHGKMAAAILTLAGCLSFAVPAAAGSVTIRPHQFVRDNNFSPTKYRVHPDRIEMLDGPETFFAPVRLPVGVTVTRLEYLHYGIDGTAVTLYRSLHQAGEERQAWFHADFPPDSSYSGDVTMVSSEAPQAGMSRVVARSTFHWVRVSIYGGAPGSAVGSIRIYWRRR